MTVLKYLQDNAKRLNNESIIIIFDTTWLRFNVAEIIIDFFLVRFILCVFFVSFYFSRMFSETDANDHAGYWINGIGTKLHSSLVVQQFYQTRVIDEFVLRGNAAILKCNLPSFIADFVIVEAWIADDGTEILPNNNDFGNSLPLFWDKNRSV